MSIKYVTKFINNYMSLKYLIMYKSVIPSYKRAIDFRNITIKIDICKVSCIFRVIFTRRKMAVYITDARTSNVNAQV